MSKEKRKPTVIHYIIALVILGVALDSCNSCMSDTSVSNTDPALAPQTSADIEMVGYWKKDRDRVFTYRIQNNVSAEEVRAHARRQMHTQGRLTYVFYYRNSVPNPTSASNLNNALTITEESTPVYSFLKMKNGQINESDFK
jgi:hypothetical protein